jgi:sec-independent protein translocase protein TatA
MQPSLLHILIVILLVVLLFGRGKISDLMGDVAVGIKNFKKGLTDNGSGKKTPAKRKKAGKGDAS